MNLFTHLLGIAQFHGAHRLTGRRYRWIWVATLLLCLWGAISIILANIWRYLETPAYQVTKELPETTVKFPSVVVCPEIRYPNFKIDAFLSGLKYPDGLNKTYIKSVIRQLAAFYAPDVSYSLVNIMNIEKLLDYNNITVESASRQLTLRCEESILRCRYLGEMMDCTDLFEWELTNFGFCCIFNGRSLRREVEDHGVQNVVAPPLLRSDRVGHTSGLMFVVNSSQIMDNIDLDYKWMYLAKGQQFIESNKNGTPISRSEEYWFGYHAVGHVLDRNANELSPEMLKCRKASEKLEYFPSYLRQYCLIECEMRRTMERCHCVSFTHPRPPTWNYCRASHLPCIRNSAVTNRDSQCDCDKTCDTTSDLIVIMNFPLKTGKYLMDPFYDGLNYSKVTIVRAFLLNYDFRINEIRTYYTEIALFSQIGGTLNVFFGCSILTLIEMIQLVWYGARQYWIGKRAEREKMTSTSSFFKQKKSNNQTAKKKRKIKKHSRKNVKFQKKK